MICTSLRLTPLLTAIFAISAHAETFKMKSFEATASGTVVEKNDAITRYSLTKDVVLENKDVYLDLAAGSVLTVTKDKSGTAYLAALRLYENEPNSYLKNIQTVTGQRIYFKPGFNYGDIQFNSDAALVTARLNFGPSDDVAAGVVTLGSEANEILCGTWYPFRFFTRNSKLFISGCVMLKEIDVPFHLDRPHGERITAGIPNDGNYGWIEYHPNGAAKALSVLKPRNFKNVGGRDLAVNGALYFNPDGILYRSTFVWTR